MGGEPGCNPVNGSGRSRLAVLLYIVAGVALPAGVWFAFDWPWIAPTAVLLFVLWTSTFFVREKLAPLVSVKLWMRKHRVDKRYEDGLLRMAKADGHRLVLRNVPHSEVALALISAYRHDGHGDKSYAELSDLIRMVQQSSAWTLGADVRPILAAMYGRKAYWHPVASSIVKWLERSAKLRLEGVELDTMLAYFQQVPADDALTAMENGIPVEYVVTA